MREDVYTLLKQRPYYLSDEDIQWVRQTMDALSDDEKIGQLFCGEIRAGDEAMFHAVTKQYGLGAVMCLPDTMERLHHLIGDLQQNSAIPLLIAGNLEEGADVFREGNNIANNLEIAAAGDARYAEEMGRITALEGGAMGIRWAFAPVSDIGMNWRNPVIATRVFGSQPDFVAEASSRFTKAMQENGMAAAVKHFPGDGVDERDQHFSPTVNTLTAEEWRRTFGIVYRRNIEAGALTFMVGHILQPAMAKEIDPSLPDAELLPASTSRELLTGVLRGELGFNGMISTDATTMTGFDQLLEREKAIPTAIEAGCDMILFSKDLAEDIAYMKAGLQNGLLSRERLDMAVLRVLGAKAALSLHRQKETGSFQKPLPEVKTLVETSEARSIAEEIADHAVTLVKKQEGLLPLTPERYKRIYLVAYAEGRGFGCSAEDVYACIKEKLEAKGFSVTCHNAQNNSAPIRGGSEQLKAQFDLILYALNLTSVSNRTVCRLDWSPSMGKDAPDHIREVPTIAVSFGNPYHLVDLPRVKTYINAYKFKPAVVDTVLRKLMGESEWKGHAPADPFCGFWDTRL